MNIAANLDSHLEALIETAVKEIGHHVNDGTTRVHEYRMSIPGVTDDGQPWCMAFVQWCIRQVELGDEALVSSLYPSEHCLTVWNKTDKAYRSQTPQAGYVVIWAHGTTGAGHTGLIEAVDAGSSKIHTIEGNTSNEDIRTGGYVERKVRPLRGMGDFKLVGFLKPF